jgi:hypothetical protein
MATTLDSERVFVIEDTEINQCYSGITWTSCLEHYNEKMMELERGVKCLGVRLPILAKLKREEGHAQKIYRHTIIHFVCLSEFEKEVNMNPDKRKIRKQNSLYVLTSESRKQVFTATNWELIVNSANANKPNDEFPDIPRSTSITLNERGRQYTFISSKISFLNEEQFMDSNFIKPFVEEEYEIFYCT